MSARTLSQKLSIRPRLRVLGALIVAFGLSAGAAPSATAGEYRLYSCQKPDGSIASTDGWNTSERHPADTTVQNSCSSGGYFYLNLGNQTHGTDAFARISLELPDGLRVGSIRTDRSVALMYPNPNADWNGSPIYAMYYDGWAYDSSHVLEACVLYTGCRGMSWPGVAPGTPRTEVAFTAAGTGFIGFSVGCGGNPGGYCASGPEGRAQVQVRATDITMRDFDDPSAESVQGTLLGAGPRSGVGSVSLTAKDRGAGVYHVIAYLDGQEVARTKPDGGASCNDAGALPSTDLEFDHVQPCKRNVSAALSLDTRAFSDGAHRLEVKVRDAAGNLGVAVDQTVTFDNVPPPIVKIKPTVSGETLASGLRPGDVIRAANGTWEGAGITLARRWQRNTAAGTWVDIPNASGEAYTVVTDDVGHGLRIVVSASNRDGTTEVASEATAIVKTGATIKTESQPKTITPTPGPLSGPAPAAAGNGAGGNPSTGQLVVDREQRTVDVRHGAKIVITGRLLDGENQPIGDASVDVFEQVAITAAPWVKIGTVKTDSQGGYVFRPKTTASRRLRFAYSARRDAADYRATREVFVSVTAAMTIRAKQRVVSRRGLIRLSGRVDIDQLPAKGAWVEVQVLDAGVWRTVATRRVDSRGRWQFKHRLRQSALVTFAFRARLRPAGDIASAESKSTPVKVRVR